MSTPAATRGAPLPLTAEQGENIIRKHLAGHDRSIVKQVTEIQNKGYSYTANARMYILDIATPSEGNAAPTLCSCFVTIESSERLEPEAYRPNSLSLVYQVLSRIRAHTDIPISDSTLDTSLEVVPFYFLLSPASPISSCDIMPLSKARESGLLSPEDTVLIDLEIGKFLGQLHNGVQNERYGLIEKDEPRDPSYSWQETFTLLLETLLSDFEAASVHLPYEDIRRYLSCAIGFFLFDDVEVPSLIWLTGSEHDIYVSLPSHPTTKTRGIAAILPNVAHALWGDPLLESFFLPPGPSSALFEGYMASGGDQLMVFPRQKTKRIWYTLFMALIVMRERAEIPAVVLVGGSSETGVASEMDKDWARRLILTCVEALAGAPCY